MGIWIFSSIAGLERTGHNGGVQLHHFLMDYDGTTPPNINIGHRTNTPKETLVRTPNGWHIIRRARLTRDELKSELFQRDADINFILMLDINQQAQLYCPSDTQITDRYWDLMRYAPGYPKYAERTNRDPQA